MKKIIFKSLHIETILYIYILIESAPGLNSINIFKEDIEINLDIFTSELISTAAKLVEELFKHWLMLCS